MIDERVKEWKYALALFTDMGFYEIIQKYPDIEQLETGYRDWEIFAYNRKIKKPVPIEFLDESGRFKILTDNEMN